MGGSRILCTASRFIALYIANLIPIAKHWQAREGAVDKNTNKNTPFWFTLLWRLLNPHGKQCKLLVVCLHQWTTLSSVANDRSIQRRDSEGSIICAQIYFCENAKDKYSIVNVQVPINCLLKMAMDSGTLRYSVGLFNNSSILVPVLLHQLLTPVHS